MPGVYKLEAPKKKLNKQKVLGIACLKSKAGHCIGEDKVHNEGVGGGVGKLLVEGLNRQGAVDQMLSTGEALEDEGRFFPDMPSPECLEDIT